MVIKVLGDQLAILQHIVTFKAPAADHRSHSFTAFNSMKMVKIKLDLENDQAEIFGEVINLDCTSSGHYCIPLRNRSVLMEECMFNLDSKDRKEKERLIIKSS